MVLVSLVFLALPAAAQPVEPNATYVRTVDKTVPNQPLVTVTVSGAAGVSCFTIEEILPACATATVLTGNGVYLPALHVIRWAPFLNTASATVSYRLGGLPANYPVNGGAWMDGQWFFSAGVTMVQVLPAGGPGAIPTPPLQVPAPGFSPPSGGVVPTSLTITDAMQTAVIHYTTDGSLPNSTSPTTLPITTLPPGQVSMVRAMAFDPNGVKLPSVATVAYYEPATVAPTSPVSRTANTGSTTTPTVNFTVTPPTGAQCFAVTETLPPGLTVNPNNISASGKYLASQNVVEWGPFLAPFPQTLSYQVATGALPGTYPVRATWSVDGTNGSEAAASNVGVASAANLAIPTPPQQVAAPGFSPPSGGVVPTSLTITDAMQTAVIHYTTDGSLPNSTSPTTLPITTLPPGQVSMVRAMAFDPNGVKLPSVVAVAYYGPPPVALAPPVSRTANTGSTTTPTVNFTVTPPTGAQCFAVTETLPPGLTVNPNNISASGKYLASQNVVEWGPFLAPFPQTLSYQVATGALPGTYPVRATWSVDGTNGNEAAASNVGVASAANLAIPPLPQQVPAPSFSPASGHNVPVAVFISCKDLNAQIYYTTDGSLPTQNNSDSSQPNYNPNSTLYPNLTPTGISLPVSGQPGSVSVLRAVAYDGNELPSVVTVAYYGPPPPADAVPLAPPNISGNGGAQPTVSLTATPQQYMVKNTENMVQCYALVETIPYGLTPSSWSVTLNGSPDPSGNGVWDPVASVIRWGPYLDNKTRTFSFQVSGASGSYALSSLASYDGYSTTTPGSVQVNAPPDTSPPMVFITSRTDGSTVDSANLLVGGTATDPDGISLVTVNGVPANNDTASAGATAKWSATVPLHSGANTIIAVASDTLNNTASAQITVYYNPPTFGNSSVSSSGGGGQNVVTTLSGLSSGDTVTVYQFTDLSDLNNPKNWTPVPGFDRIPATGSTLTLTIPITPGSSGPYYIFTVTPP